MLAYAGSLTSPSWLDEEQARRLPALSPTPTCRPQARDFARRALEGMPDLAAALDEHGDRLAWLRESHSLVRFGGRRHPPRAFGGGAAPG